MDTESADPVRHVLESLSAHRGAELVHRFDHGVGGTSLIALDGSRQVLKAWPASEEDRARLDTSLELADTMRTRGVAVPRVLERGEVGGVGYALYEHLPGAWSDQLGPEAMDGLVQIVDAERDAAPHPNPGWHDELRRMLARGDASFDIDPQALLAAPAAARVLEEARRRLDACAAGSLRTADIVHGDFAPENVLLHEGRVVGVVDWERARIGDAGIDLVGAIFDLEIWEKAAAGPRRRLWTAASERMPPEALAAYVGVYAVRYLSWSVGTSMESQVLDLAHRLLERTHDPT
ncbi:phosphotransferase family protein [Brachybacterium sacelli]|uniref:Ser/Thr protein kinase RdoA (MazF antagonist) n=1 Tax=Brachybacterium sacelli TaxID=173364 RepID=A0ABS4WVU7_9MICO|nr:aminoglycoside phosphotransferase family protein [Brachybacterium sacelli]MBP2380331.1 Ser/Thr protein kinase RdoA (MazF antagonist) [Brachybacterium sacelli]